MSGADLFGAARPLACLSLWEPWASLIFAGVKLHETRSWPTKRRGRVAIHAAKRVVTDIDPQLAALCEFALGAGWERNRPIGCVLGVADLTGCFASDHLAEGRPPLLDPVAECDFIAGDFADGRFGFRLDRAQALREPLPLIGRQGFFNWVPPAALASRLLAAVDHDAAALRWAEHAREVIRG